MSFEVHKIISRQDLREAITFIHENKFSLKTFENKISFNLDQRILGLSIKENGKIVGNIFYYYQPNFNYNNIVYKVVNFATIFVHHSCRGKGIPRLMIENTLNIFKDYIITDYTPVGNIKHLLKKLNFGYMQNNRNLILPIPKISFDIFKNFFGKLSKINEKEEIDKIFNNLEQYRHYEIELWRYKKGSDNIIIGTIDRNHKKKISFFNLKAKSKRILWTDNEEMLIKYANNIAFNFYILDKFSFITIDTKIKRKLFFSFKLENQFMIFPNLKIKIPTIGSEFFSNNL